MFYFELNLYRILNAQIALIEERKQRKTYGESSETSVKYEPKKCLDMNHASTISN
jgi:hypothetical protein